MRFRAWYDDGSVYDSGTDPEYLPPDGLLGVVEYLPFDTPKRHILTGYDRYFWWRGPKGLVIGGNSDDRATIEARYPGAVIVRGRWTTHEHMREVQRAMQAAHEGP
jgi:hypothetical protein